jgi:hypothetical protein
MELQISKALNLSDEETKSLSEKLSSQLVDTVEGSKAEAASVALKSVEQSKVETVKVQSKTKAIVS